MRAGQVATLAAAITCAALTSTAEQWQPLALVLVLLGVMALSDAFSVKMGSIQVSGSFVALAGAMVILGPAPAVAIGILASIYDLARRRPGWGDALTNLSTFAAFPLLGAELARLLRAEPLALEQQWLVVPAVIGVFLVANVLNFWAIALDVRVTEGTSVRGSFRDVYSPMLPVDFVMGVLTSVAVLGYYALGAGAVALLILVALTFQFLLRTVWLAHQRGEALEGRTQELSALQVGLLSTVMQTLSLRDAMTARHSAAVARYAREMARELGLSSEEQDLIHTAGLLHDIGKFIFPDSILFAARGLTDEEFDIVRLHPEQGARLVQRIDGYGPVAEIIHAHHERIDGGGYPRGLFAPEIPLGSRIISIADTYDVMVSRDSYRTPVSPDEAIVELRRVSNAQLDAELVELFVGLLGTRGVQFRHTDDADFEEELSFERRVQDYAQPRLAEA